MNRLRTQKFKPDTDAIQYNVNNNNSNNNNDNSNADSCPSSPATGSQPGAAQRSASTSGLLNKLSKRYSTLSSRITRRHHHHTHAHSLHHPQRTEGGGGERKSGSPQKLITGSYDMNGARSDDHRLEIGAPILISTTTLDTERLDVTAERLQQIGGGVAATSGTFVRSDKPLLLIAASALGHGDGLATVQAKAQSVSPPLPSSGSENEVFVDALSTTPVVEEQFEDALQHYDTPRKTGGGGGSSSTPATPTAAVAATAQPLVAELKVARSGAASPVSELYAVVQLQTQMEAKPPPPPLPEPVKRQPKKLSRKPHSKSAQNLHRSELRVVLQKAPSMELATSSTLSVANGGVAVADANAEEEDGDDELQLLQLPLLPELYGASKCSLAASSNSNGNDNSSNSNNNITACSLDTAKAKANAQQQWQDDSDADKENSSPSVVGVGGRLQSKSEPNTPLGAEPKLSGYLAAHKQLQPQQQQQQQEHKQLFRSIDSLEQSERKDGANGSGGGSGSVSTLAGKRRSVVFSSSGSIGPPLHSSKNSLATSTHSQSSTLNEDGDVDDDDDDDDFSNLLSVSCQSLNAQTLFVSIDELNEITRQINESEEFNRDIDLEYCTHRDNLKPSERRITLLKNKNTRLISFNNNKEKLKKGWSGVKHWFGEEGTKLREAVAHKHGGTLQRLAHVAGSATTSRLNLHQPAECRQSPSTQGSVLLGGGGPIYDTGLQLPPNGGNIELLPESVNNTSDTIDTSAADSSGAGGGEELNVRASSQAAEAQPIDADEDDGDGDGDASPVQSKRLRREGQNGFEELRRYVKQGGDFGKELILILQERVDSEMLYSKSLSKMASKLNKACRELPGSVAEAWRGVATEMESRSDIHRQLSVSFTDEIVKPLKGIVDSHHKSRKSVESNVDKSARVLAEWRVSEAKAKKSSHTAARENEKLQDAMLDVRIQKSPSIALLHQGPNKVAAEKEIKSAEKDCAKLDHKRKKAEEAVKRADVEYYTLCIRAERARVDWEMAVLRGSALLQSIENQRLINMKNFVANYARLTSNMNPILDSMVQRLQPQADACNVVKDMQVIKNIRRNSEGPSEQLLPDFYCEHTTLAMNRERRKHALIKLLQLVKTDLERERRSRNGLKGLSQSLNNQDNQNITDKLYHIRSMLTYLEGARFKLHSALLELDHKPRSSHPLAQHIQITRDRTGLQQSILKVPLWLKNNDKLATSAATGDDSVPPDHEYDCISQANTNVSNASCMDLSKESALLKNFSRSKSNIETFSTNTQICTNITASAGIAHKNKTLAAGHSDDPYSDRGQADGGSNQQDSDFDEFSSQDDDVEHTPSARKEHRAIVEKSVMLTNGHNMLEQQHQHQHHLYQNPADLQQQQQQQQQHGDTNCVSHSVNNTNININNINNSNHNNINHHIDSSNNNNNISNSSIVLSRCKALYSYTPKLYDELELNPGDIIEVHAKQDDGWWLGALRNQVGIFPATYVEEFA